MWLLLSLKNEKYIYQPRGRGRAATALRAASHVILTNTPECGRGERWRRPNIFRRQRLARAVAPAQAQGPSCFPRTNHRFVRQTGHVRASRGATAANDGNMWYVPADCYGLLGIRGVQSDILSGKTIGLVGQIGTLPRIHQVNCKARRMPAQFLSCARKCSWTVTR